MEEKTQTTEKNRSPAGSKIKPLYILAVIVVLAVLVAGYFVISSSAVPVVAAGDTVKVNYVGTFTNGTVFDSSTGKQPLEFTVGAGQVIKGFDQAVVGMKLNQEKTVTLPVNEAYGPVNPALIMEVPLSNFGNQTVQKGMQVTDDVNQEQLQGVVTSVNATTATLDFNPALAGQTLIFNITVVGIQKAG